MIQCQQVKTPVPGLIIHDLHVNVIRILRNIHAVDDPDQLHLLLRGLSATSLSELLHLPEFQFISERRKDALFQLLLHGHYRAKKDPFHPPDLILVSVIVFQNAAMIFRCLLFHGLSHGAPREFLIKGKPCLVLCSQAIRELLQNTVINVSEIHGLEAILLPFPKGQAILQKMPVGAGCKGLQAADAVLEHLPINQPGNLRKEPCVLMAQKCRRKILLPLFSVFLAAVRLIQGIKLLLPLIPKHSSGEFPQGLREHAAAFLGRHHLLEGRHHLRDLHRDIREKTPYRIQEIGGAHGLSVAPLPRIGQEKPLRGLGQVQVEIEALNEHELAGRGRQRMGRIL